MTDEVTQAVSTKIDGKINKLEASVAEINNNLGQKSVSGQITSALARQKKSTEDFVSVRAAELESSLDKKGLSEAAKTEVDQKIGAAIKVFSQVV